MTYKDYREKLKNIQSRILELLDNDFNIEENIQNLYQYIDENKLDDDQQKIKSIIYLISRIIDNHHHKTDFYNKIERILLFFREKIIFYFSNFEIYNFFKNNKRILLFLIEFRIITIDEDINYQMSQTYDYSRYFSPEIELFLEALVKDLGSDGDSESTDESDGFSLLADEDSEDENRIIGENDKYICQLIRNDKVNEFKSYIYDNSYSFNMKIEPSIYESNIFLLKNNETTLIEYSAFFGSIEIFKFLYSNNVKMTPRLWLYAVHGNNEEIILFLEQNMKIESYLECFKEAVKCHHNSIANYIQTKFLNQNEIKNKIENNYKENPYSYGFHYYNFFYLPEYLINNKFIFYYACEYDYYMLVKLLMKMKAMDINLKIIFFF